MRMGRNLIIHKKFSNIAYLFTYYNYYTLYNDKLQICNKLQQQTTIEISTNKC